MLGRGRHEEAMRDGLVFGLGEERGDVLLEGSDCVGVGESQKDGNKVGHGAKVDKDVPDGVIKVEGVKDDEGDARGVGEATNEAPFENGPRTDLHRRSRHNHTRPSHEQVESIGQHGRDHMNGDKYL